MSGRSAELYDYDELRRTAVATVFSPVVTAPLIVLGSRQSESQLRDTTMPVRRRRGGGGAVLLRAGDLWLDFWVPCDDGRHREDVRVAAGLIGSWWRDALADVHPGEFLVHDGPGTSSASCFGSIGDGEVEQVRGDGTTSKVVGLTQWRVREGSLLSTVLHAHSTSELATHLVSGVRFEHDSLDTLGLQSTASALRDAVLARGGPWAVAVTAPVP